MPHLPTFLGRSRRAFMEELDCTVGQPSVSYASLTADNYRQILSIAHCMLSVILLLKTSLYDAC